MKKQSIIVNEKNEKKYFKLCQDIKAIFSVFLKFEFSNDKKIRLIDGLLPILKLKKKVEKTLKKETDENVKDDIKYKILKKEVFDFKDKNMKKCDEYMKYKKSKDPDYVFPNTIEDLQRKGWNLKPLSSPTRIYRF